MPTDDAAIALLRLLPPGRWYAVVNFYRWLALLTLLVLGGVFAVQQVRSALYPVSYTHLTLPTNREV